MMDRQRMLALEKANDVRRKRRDFKLALREAGKVEAPDMLADKIRNPPDWLATARAGEVLTWCPFVGANKAKRMLGGEVKPSTSLDSLTQRQRTHLIGKLRARAE